VEPLPGRTRCCLTCSDDPNLQGIHLAWCEVRNGTHHSQADASLGVGHVWTNTDCKSYRTYDPLHCTCREQKRLGRI
jgi:hypothetical protein